MKNKNGLFILVIGALHLILGIIKFKTPLYQMFIEGLFNTAIGAERGWAVWFIITGVLLVCLGLTIKQLELSNHPPPMSLGWVLLFTSIVGIVLIPISGFWILLIPSVRILFNKTNILRSSSRK